MIQEIAFTFGIRGLVLRDGVRHHLLCVPAIRWRGYPACLMDSFRVTALAC